MKIKLVFTILFATFHLLQLPTYAATAKSLKVKVTLASGIKKVYAISKKGRVFSPKVSGNANHITIPTADIAGASLYAISSDGQTLGPVYAKSGSKGLLFLAKTPKDKNKKAISALAVKLQALKDGENFAVIKSVPKGNVFDTKYKYTMASTPQFGQNSASAVSTLRTGKLAAASNDSDGDGVVNRLDVDADGDGIPNTADASTDVGSSSIGTQVGEGIDVPFSALYLSFDDTINWHLNGSLTQSQIDAVLGGANKFSIAFFFTPPLGTSTTSINGGHVVCDSSLAYCKPTVGSDTGTAIYSGFSEGNQSLTGRVWSTINTDGSEYSLEKFNVGSNVAVAASFQPRVGTAQFRPGDNYRVDFTNSSGSVISSSSLTLPPYFLTVPAARAFNVTSNDAGSDTLLTYGTAGSIGSNQSNPIVLATTGDFAGKLRLSLFRLQRLATDDEASRTGSTYLDFGHLNYGVTINNNSGEFTCGGLYEGLSSTLTETTSAGSGGSFKTSDGAILWPLVDSSDDYAPSSATDSTTIGNNTVAFTVNLASCLTRNGLTAGTHQISVFAAGQDTGHGSNRAAQTLWVTIP